LGFFQGSHSVSPPDPSLGHHQGYGDATFCGGEEFARCLGGESGGFFQDAHSAFD
jgi:hypothetical protein